MAGSKVPTRNGAAAAMCFVKYEEGGSAGLGLRSLPSGTYGVHACWRGRLPSPVGVNQWSCWQRKLLSHTIAIYLCQQTGLGSLRFADLLTNYHCGRQLV
jgi:hypothetical protein